MSRKGASLVHSLVVEVENMPMGSSRLGGLLLRRAPLRMEDPRAGTSGFKESTPCVTSYNKGQCDERLALAVWARVIAGLCERLAQKKTRRVPASTSTGLEAAAGAAAPRCRQQQPNYISYARRTTKAIETI